MSANAPPVLGESTAVRQPPAAADARKELTVRGVVLGVLITLIFTAANVFFGLKAGLTFATSIPAAVISMAVLRGFKDATVQENNIVQTVASAAGTLSAIIFVLPGLVIIGWWTGFPYWISASICGLGGVLGVMYSIPLRRALVTESDLPFPEGVACAEVLKVGSGDETRAGLLAVIGGSVVSAVFALVVATRIFASDLARYFRVGAQGAVTGFDLLFSIALFGIGHLVGLWVGVAIGLGAVIAWMWGVPHYSALNAGHGAAAAVAQATWSHQVRFVGAGTILIAAIWTLLTLVKPVYGGLRSALAASRARRAGQQALMPRTEQDIPIGIVALVTLVCLAPIAVLLANFNSGGALTSQMTVLVIGGVVFIALMSFFVSSVFGYMAGLIGASNSPLSGIGILAVIGAALLMVAGVRPYLPTSAQPALVAYALFVTSVVFAVATIANNNLQDLKTGQLVDATPWKQQVALVFGVAAGAVIIPPVLDLLNHAYGFAGAPGIPRHNPLPAPQAGLISALAQGVLLNNVDWSLIGVGIAIGIGMIVINAALRRATGGRVHLSPLAVGLGIYLPTQSTLMVVFGALAGWYFDRRADRRGEPAAVKQLGVLFASGLIVGEGLVGVLVAAFVAFSGKDFPLSLVGDQFAATDAVVLSCVAFTVTMLFMYRWVARLHR